MFHNNYIGFLSVALFSALIFLFLRIWQNKIRKSNLFSYLFTSTSTTVRTTLGIALVFLLFYMDFLRDYVFHNLSYRMDYLFQIENGGSPDKYADYTDSFMLKILEGANSSTVYYLKYVASFLFILIYASLTFLITKLIYPKMNSGHYVILIYGLGFLAMAWVFSWYFFTWGHDTKLSFYLISMEIGHFLESSLPTLLSILGFKFYLSSQAPEPNE